MRYESSWHVIGTTLALGLVASLMVPDGAGAQGRYGVAFQTGFSTYAQSDLNQGLIAPINALLSGTGRRMDDVSSGLGLGVGFRYRSSTSPVTLALDYERLYARSKGSVPGYRVDLEAPADAFTATVYYYVSSSPRARFGVGVGGGIYSAAGALHEIVKTMVMTRGLTGSGGGFHVLGAADVALYEPSYLDVAIGYRHAKSKDMNVVGVKVLSSDGTPAKFDWSGLMTRVGLSVYFGSK